MEDKTDKIVNEKKPIAIMDIAKKDSTIKTEATPVKITTNTPLTKIAPKPTSTTTNGQIVFIQGPGGTAQTIRIAGTSKTVSSVVPSGFQLIKTADGLLQVKQKPPTTTTSASITTGGTIVKTSTSTATGTASTPIRRIIVKGTGGQPLQIVSTTKPASTTTTVVSATPNPTALISTRKYTVAQAEQMGILTAAKLKELVSVVSAGKKVDQQFTPILPASTTTGSTTMATTTSSLASGTTTTTTSTTSTATASKIILQQSAGVAKPITLPQNFVKLAQSGQIKAVNIPGKGIQYIRVATATSKPSITTTKFVPSTSNNTITTVSGGQSKLLVQSKGGQQTFTLLSTNTARKDTNDATIKTIKSPIISATAVVTTTATTTTTTTTTTTASGVTAQITKSAAVTAVPKTSIKTVWATDASEPSQLTTIKLENKDEDKSSATNTKMNLSTGSNSKSSEKIEKSIKTEDNTPNNPNRPASVNSVAKIITVQKQKSALSPSSSPPPSPPLHHDDQSDDKDDENDIDENDQDDVENDERDIETDENNKNPLILNSVLKMTQNAPAKIVFKIESNEQKPLSSHLQQVVNSDNNFDLIKCLPEAPRRKHCNCTKSQCLKLYCDCFANGEFCFNCNCKECFNNLENEDERLKAIKVCLERNPHAFKPKIGKSKDQNETLRRHTKGCNCKRSGCLKNYCECYEAKITCSGNCKCIGCRNVEDAYNGAGRMAYVDSMLLPRPLPTSSATSLSRTVVNNHNIITSQKRPYEAREQREQSPLLNAKKPCNFMTQDVIEATIQCVIAQADECQQKQMDKPTSERMILEEFGRCLVEIIEFSIKNNEN